MDLDSALLTTYNLDPSLAISIWSQVEECENCSLAYHVTIDPNSNESIVLDTRYKVTLEVRDEESDYENLCKIPYRWFNNQGIYALYYTRENVTDNCEISTIYSGKNDMIPIYLAVVFYVFLSFGWYIYRNKCSKRNIGVPNDNTSQRLKSLDAFRGLTIIMMIFVNYGAAGYVFLEHKPWFGLTIADVIFPWFIFIMGVSLTLSIESQVKKGEQSVCTIWTRIWIRSLKLFLLGLCLNILKNLISDGLSMSVRIPGVLQRFAICYFLVASCRLFTVKFYTKFKLSIGNKPIINLIFLPEIFVYLGCLILYFWYTFFWEYDPLCPKGYQGPGGFHNLGTAWNCTGGAANKIDRIILGENHLYRTSSSTDIYANDLYHDPEGLLGFTTSIILTAIGALSGRVILITNSPKKRMIHWLLGSLCLAIIGFVSNQWIPVVKNLWSFSYITYTGSLSLMVLTLFYWLIDVSKIWENGIPFIYPGMNAILLYLGSYIGSAVIWASQHAIAYLFGINNTSHGRLLWRILIAINIWFIISYSLFRRRIFISL